MQIQLVEGAPRNRRKTRTPRVDTSTLFLPFCVVPFAFHPVLPGETLKSLWYNMQYVSDPLKARHQTGWLDTLFFYVKHSQLPIRDDLIAMHVDGVPLPNSGSTARLAAQSLAHWGAAGGVNFEKLCYDHVIKWYFRDSDESLTPASGLIGGFQPAQLQRDGWWQSLKLADLNPTADHLLPGEFPEQPTDGVDETKWATAYTQWQRMRALGMTEATYEDYLRAQGVSSVSAENDEQLLRPELICRNGEFVMPVNAIEPSTGYPRTAHVKQIKGRTEKAKYFKEPGWIIGVQVWRPKVHLGAVTGTMAGYMDSPEDWMPASLSQHPYTSIKMFNEATGPGPIQTTGDVQMAVDLRDYLLYGEQRVNYALNQTSTPYTTRATAMFAPSLPRANTGDVKYLTETEAKGVFLEPSEAVYMRGEGIVSFSIASTIGDDTTP